MQDSSYWYGQMQNYGRMISDAQTLKNEYQIYGLKLLGTCTTARVIFEKASQVSNELKEGYSAKGLELNIDDFEDIYKDITKYAEKNNDKVIELDQDIKSAQNKFQYAKRKYEEARMRENQL